MEKTISCPVCIKAITRAEWPDHVIWHKRGPTCHDCGREFSLSDPIDASEFYYGHDCEARQASQL